MKGHIAIIGMAGRFPGAHNLQQLYQLLSQGKDSVGHISASRVKNTTLDPHREHMVCGYLEDIDVFDHNLFNISAGEAQTMDPHMRLLLEVAYETFENAAYAIDAIRASNTAVFVADAALEYYKLADTFVPTLASGNTKAFLASMISRQFDLRGTSLTVDTTCSSSLLAVHLACNELLLGNAEMALAGGANLYLFPYKESGGLDLDAPDGRSKAFSAQANGMSHGEAIACVLLKRLDQALADGDIIHAVIRSSAANSNAGRSASITAPDSEAQAEVIRMAWEKSGIDPRRIGFIETHGSGTILGDNIEVGGLTLAFNTYTDEKQWCPIATIKSNIGHTRAAAGIAGLLKAVLSLKHQVLFPNIHFEAPHPQISFHRSAVFVNRELRPWVSDSGTRYAGVSSIGLSGTNCHMVLEQAPERPIRQLLDDHQKNYLLPVSSHTHEGLRDNVAALLDHLSVLSNDELVNVSYTLWCGRKHYEHRVAFIAADIAQARENMSRWLHDDRNPHTNRKPLHKLVFVLDEGDGTLEHYRLQYQFYQLLADSGISTSEIMAVNGGRQVVRAIKGELDISAALEQIARAEIENVANLEERVSGWLGRETENGRVVLLCIGNSPGELSRELQKQTANNNCCFISAPADAGYTSFLQVIKGLYEENVTGDWKKLGERIQGSRIELPSYRFRRTHCWIRKSFPAVIAPVIQQEEMQGTAATIKWCWKTVLNIQDCQLHDNFFELGGDSIKATQVINRLNAAYNTNLDFEDLFDYPTIAALAAYLDATCSIEQKVYRIWKDVLKQENLEYDDNFFDLGGHSLIANQIINRIRKEFNSEISFDDFFRFPTIRLLSAYLDSQQGKPPAILANITRLSPKEHYEVSHAQKRLWILGQSQEGAVAYNQPGLYKVRSVLNISMLEKAFEALIARHEILRTTFTLTDQGLVQKVGAPNQSLFKLAYLDFRGKPDPEASALQYANERAGLYFDLETGPLLDVAVIQTGDPSYVILLNLHHIITDGWSNRVLIYDLLTFYNALNEGRGDPLSPLRIQYKDYAAWQNEQIRNGAFDVHRDYWLQQFQEQALPLSFPADFPRPSIKSYQGRIMEFSIDEELARDIHEYARQHDVTLFMMLLANLYILLYRFSGQCDITIGTTLANRDHVDLENQIGFYVNTLAIRAQFDPHITFDELLEIAKNKALRAFEHGVYPFDLLVDNLQLERDLSRSPLFDVMLTLQNMEHNRQFLNNTIQELDVESIETDIHVSKFDLVFNVSEQNGRLYILLEYDTALLMESTVEKIRTGFVSIFRQILEQPNMTINDIRTSLFYASEKEQVNYYKDFSETDLGTNH